jgi:23S rRNA pseudouridine1911/1915/1917 synthase
VHNRINNISLCSIDNFSSLEEMILDVFKVSKNQIKKSRLSKKKLARKIAPKDVIELPLNLVNYLLVNPEYSGEKPIILLENQSVLAISKPVKVHGHPLSYCESDNVLSYLNSIGRSDLLRVNESNYDRGLLYRLDFETSGLLILSKTNGLYNSARNNLEDIVKSKVYLAIVDGECRRDEKLSHYLKVGGSKNKDIEVFDQFVEGSKQVECNVKFLAYNKEQNLSLIEVTLFQGHRHQIRKQLQGIGHCILGDPLYGTREAERMFLHCWKYSINLSESNTDRTIEIIDNNVTLFNNLFNFDC